MDHSYLAILLGSLILAGVAKLVRSSGQNHILTIDYAKIADPDRLHQWAAKCLNIAALESAVLALAAFLAPAYAGLVVALFGTVVIGMALVITLGARKFRRA